MTLLNRAAALAVSLVLTLTGAPPVDPKLALSMLLHRRPAYVGAGLRD